MLIAPRIKYVEVSGKVYLIQDKSRLAISMKREFTLWFHTTQAISNGYAASRSQGGYFNVASMHVITKCGWIVTGAPVMAVLFRGVLTSESNWLTK